MRRKDPHPAYILPYHKGNKSGEKNYLEYVSTFKCLRQTQTNLRLRCIFIVLGNILLATEQQFSKCNWRIQAGPETLTV